MSLQPGTTLGPYRIQALLGAGGMGEVYKATDTRLDRTVAIKVLPEHVAADPDTKQRFEREARSIAALNHPHICTLYDVGQEDGTDFLVMEYLDGETLAERLEKGALPLDQALQIAVEIADALDKAHRQGIVHRDLKPGNIMLTKAGAKLLDFGLAKLRPAEVVSTSQALTRGESLTGEGTILGTLQYMAPEQLEGKPSDHRTDIFAFGAIVYEMVTGERAFSGDSQASLIHAIIGLAPPAMASLQPVTPQGLHRVVVTCLAKDPDHRWQSVRDLTHELRWLTEAQSTVGISVDEPRQGSVYWRVISRYGGAAVAGVIVTVGLMWGPSGLQAPGVVRFSIPLPVGQRFAFSGRPLVTIAPDGSGFAYSATDGRVNGLWFRSLDEARATLVAGTEQEARGPFFSADGQWIGYWAGELKKVPVGGGLPVTIAAAAMTNGSSWGTDDMIVYSQPEGILRVPASGGQPELLVPNAPGETLRGPQMLPGNEWVLFNRLDPGERSWDNGRIVLRSLATGDEVTVAVGRDGRYLETGHLAYVIDNVLHAVVFDLDTRSVVGAAVPLVDGVSVTSERIEQGAAHFSVSSSGALVYVPGTASTNAGVLTWAGLNGDAQDLLPLPPGVHRAPRIAADSKRVAVSVRREGTADIWIWNVQRETFTQLTFDEADDDFPVWAPSDDHIVFWSDRGGGGLFLKASDGTGQVRRLSDRNAIPHGWSPDGRLIFEEDHDVGLLSLDGSGMVEMTLSSEAREFDPALSPDGRWLAYVSDESGVPLVYVRPFFDMEAGQQRVSPGYGVNPVWTPDGGGLYYRDAVENRLMFAEIETSPTLNVFSTATAFSLAPYSNQSARASASDRRAREFDLSPSGEEFIFRTTPRYRAYDDDAFDNGLVFVQNWREELLERVPAP